MGNKEKYQIEATLKNLLYFVEDKQEQDRMISVLEKYNGLMPDNKVADWLQKQWYKTKNDYYSKVDFLVNDMLDSKSIKQNKDKIKLMMQELESTIIIAEKSFWDKLCDLFKWS